MADGCFNISKGRIAYYASLPAANDALIVVLLKAAGLEADDTLNNYDDLGALLAASNDEADFTNYARKTLSSVTVTVDDTNNRVDLSAANVTWSSAGGATNNSIGKFLVCYDPDTTTGTDSSVIPVTYHDAVFTTDGTDQTITIPSPGFARAA
ncbi:MAG TPA: hypothetical protein VJT49_14900 [Amycolatopsis sp.]|uniref:hypothetical protein n=1 Tax=Amycolatopsis sp. TaxID=37632 RepID=UPI002B461D57|nr:hypothetical protein [Amycolatopsis sp.]HKS46367.1 hypothetical protein [Amycolatopsis sp.]